MGCNAWNHPKNCSCGWGGTWHGNTPYGGGRDGAPRKPVEQSYPPALPLSMRSASLDLRSLTVPNARCPVCGMSVFFYRNSYGSRVFFDDLGPPWPKHPCTDTGTLRENRSAQITAPARKPKRPRRLARPLDSVPDNWLGRAAAPSARYRGRQVSDAAPRSRLSRLRGQCRLCAKESVQ